MAPFPFLKRFADHVPDLQSTTLQQRNKGQDLQENPVPVEFSGIVADIFRCSHGDHMTIKARKLHDEDGEPMGVDLATAHCEMTEEDKDDIFMAFRVNDPIRLKGELRAFDIFSRSGLTLGEPSRHYSIFLDPCEVINQ